MKIDVFPHIIPLKYKDALYKKTMSNAGQQGRREVDKTAALPSLFDLDVRFRIMDKYEGLLQVLTLGAPPVEAIATPKDAVELAKIANDGMAELVAKYPDKFVGAIACLPMNDMVPFFGERIRVVFLTFEKFGITQQFAEHLTKRPLDYYRMFYADTATSGSTSALMCGYDFFGADHMLFGTDMPYDAQLGDICIRQGILAIEQMDIPDSEKKKIFEENARDLFRLSL